MSVDARFDSAAEVILSSLAEVITFVSKEKKRNGNCKKKMCRSPFYIYVVADRWVARN